MVVFSSGWALGQRDWGFCMAEGKELWWWRGVERRWERVWLREKGEGEGGCCYSEK
ncbi:sucrose-phosphate synthase [Sesbania bispinosa]|nr:sucrose-phosphate synthase [Sesbania bispinosa]